MRPDIAASLLTFQAQWGDDLEGVLNEATPDSGAVQIRQAIVLKQTSGLQAGGVFALDVGSYRFGRSPNSVILEPGKLKEAQFGLTIDKGGAVMLYPPSTGLGLDGMTVNTPTPIEVGQIIAAGHDRFELAPKERLLVRRESELEQALPPVPAPIKGRSIDLAVVDWARDARDRAVRVQRSLLAGPVEIHGRIERGELFNVGRSDSSFGQVMVATTDIPYVLPQEVMTTNQATLDELEATLGLLPGVPIGVDLRRQSLAIVAPQSMSRAVASWLALSLAVQSNPADLGIDLQVATNATSWDWLRRFPHTEQPEQPSLRLKITDDPRLADGALPGTILLAGSKTAGLEQYGAVLTISAHAASFLDRSQDNDGYVASPVGISSGLALERSLLISDHMSNSDVSI